MTTATLCPTCGASVLSIPSRFWPYRLISLDALPVADGRYAISAQDGTYRTLAEGERPLARAMSLAYQYHECKTPKGDAA